MTEQPARNARIHASDRSDQRDPFGQDRDRILYTTALRRLAGTTQVVSVAEGHVFHNRLTHTLEVAQIARRLAEHLLAIDQGRAHDFGGLHPEVAEAAALAHDLGHPPFGHIGEEEIDRLVVGAGVPDGFEGNAQSFRVVTKMTKRQPAFAGLNLTRATLNGVLKYPWFRTTAGKQHRKYGAYRSEEPDFLHARSATAFPSLPSLEAAVMNHADDIAYSVHDLYDFFRAGLIPLELIALNDAAADDFVSAVFARWQRGGATPELPRPDFEAALNQLRALFPLTQRFDGSLQHRAALRSLTSLLIGRYLQATAFAADPAADGSTISINPAHAAEIKVLQELTRQYVIFRPSLAAIQEGERRLIRVIFRSLLNDARGQRALLPQWANDLLDEALKSATNDTERGAARVRLVADTISSLTEDECQRLFLRLRGYGGPSVLDPIMR